MKSRKNKAALAAAALACLFGAQAAAQSVQVYGLAGMYLGTIKRSGEQQAVTQLNGGGLTTSFIGVKGSEALGGGAQLIFALESFFRPDTGEQGRSSADPLFSRNAWIGVEGSYGRLTLGRQTNPMYTAMLQLSPFGSSVVFSPLALQTFVVAYGSNVAGDTVWNNVLQYATPSVNGWRGTAVYGLGEQAGRAGLSNAGLHATYNKGPLTTALSAQRLRMNLAVPLAYEQNAWLAGAAYDFGPIKLYGNAARASVEHGTASRLLDAGLSLPLGAAGTLSLESARSNLTPASGITSHRRTTSLGYGYRLSKRTDLYAIYVNDKKSTAANAGTTAVGIRHVF